MRSDKYMLRLYPRAWRQRYEEEMLALLELRPCSFLESVDLLFGALDAHFHPHLGTSGLSLYERMKQMLSLLRRSLLTMFCASTGFLLAGIGFQKMNEYDDFTKAAQTVSLVGFSFHLVGIGTIMLFRFALLLSVPATIATALILVAMLVWGLSLHSSVPQLFNSTEGMFGSSTPGTWLGIIIAMTMTTVIAIVSLVRGLSARSALRSTDLTVKPYNSVACLEGVPSAYNLSYLAPPNLPSPWTPHPKPRTIKPKTTNSYPSLQTNHNRKK